MSLGLLRGPVRIRIARIRFPVGFWRSPAFVFVRKICTASANWLVCTLDQSRWENLPGKVHGVHSRNPRVQACMQGNYTELWGYNSKLKTCTCSSSARIRSFSVHDVPIQENTVNTNVHSWSKKMPRFLPRLHDQHAKRRQATPGDLGLFRCTCPAGNMEACSFCFTPVHTLYSG